MDIHTKFKLREHNLKLEPKRWLVFFCKAFWKAFTLHTVAWLWWWCDCCCSSGFFYVAAHFWRLQISWGAFSGLGARWLLSPSFSPQNSFSLRTLHHDTFMLPPLGQNTFPQNTPMEGQDHRVHRFRNRSHLFKESTKVTDRIIKSKGWKAHLLQFFAQCKEFKEDHFWQITLQPLKTFSDGKLPPPSVICYIAELFAIRKIFLMVSWNLPCCNLSTSDLVLCPTEKQNNSLPSSVWEI